MKDRKLVFQRCTTTESTDDEKTRGKKDNARIRAREENSHVTVGQLDKAILENSTCHRQPSIPILHIQTGTSSVKEEKKKKKEKEEKKKGHIKTQGEKKGGLESTRSKRGPVKRLFHEVGKKRAALLSIYISVQIYIYIYVYCIERGNKGRGKLYKSAQGKENRRGQRKPPKKKRLPHRKKKRKSGCPHSKSNVKKCFSVASTCLTKLKEDRFVWYLCFALLIEIRELQPYCMAENKTR